MNYSEALSFSFQDQAWAKKIAIGGLMVFVAMFTGVFFFVGFFAIGYYVTVLRNVMHGEAKPLPEWRNCGKLFGDGILGGIIFLIYFLVIGGITALFIVKAATDSDLYRFELAMTITVISLVALLSLSIFANLGLMQFAATNDFAAAFNLSEIFRLLRNDFGNYFSITILSIILNGILFMAGIGIFSPFTNFWGFMVQAHLFGQCAKSVSEPRAVVSSV
jgi:hypothetical protein